MNRKFGFLESIDESYREPLAGLSNAVLELDKRLKFKVNCFDWWVHGKPIGAQGFSIFIRKSRVGTVHYTRGGQIRVHCRELIGSVNIQDAAEFEAMWGKFAEQVLVRLDMLAKERAKRRCKREYNKAMRERFEQLCYLVSKAGYDEGC